jgi:hypothetical protein
MRLLLASILLTGCAHPVATSPQDANISAAVVSSQRIDDKAVIIAKWLNQN